MPLGGLLPYGNSMPFNNALSNYGVKQPPARRQPPQRQPFSFRPTVGHQNILPNAPRETPGNLGQLPIQNAQHQRPDPLAPVRAPIGTDPVSQQRLADYLQQGYQLIGGMLYPPGVAPPPPPQYGVNAYGF